MEDLSSDRRDDPMILELLHHWLEEEFPLLARRRSRATLMARNDGAVRKVAQRYLLRPWRNHSLNVVVCFWIKNDSGVRMSCSEIPPGVTTCPEFEPPAKEIMSPVTVDLHHPRALNQLYTRLKTWYAMFNR